MTTRSIQLRWAGRCSRCSARLPVGATADFDPVCRELTCARCADGQLPLPLPDPPPPSPSRRARGTADERARIRALIDEAKAALHAGRKAS
jgi:hypothetical protein